MIGSNSKSIHGNRHGEEPPVARAELRQMADSLLEAMERMLDARIPTDGRRAPRHQYNESGAENSDAGHDSRDGRGGGRRAGCHGQDGGRAHGRGRGHHVHFDDEEFEWPDENHFANDGLHGWRHDHRRCVDHGDKRASSWSA